MLSPKVRMRTKLHRMVRKWAKAIPAHARVRSKTSLKSAHLHYTTGTTPINKLDWETRPASLDNRQVISCPVPDEAALWFLTVTDERDAIVSSELVFANELK